MNPMRHPFPSTLVLTLLAALIPATAAAQETVQIPEPALFPQLISVIRVTGPLDFCGERVPLEEREVRERLEKELLLYIWDRAQVILWLKRCGRYMPYIEKMLRENRMPEDLKYVAVVESALLPHIGSSKGAVGYWQFIRPTGRKFGLDINGEVDERRNIFTSTLAAVRYFKSLYAEFGSWTLSAAAYNMGEAGLRRRIQAQKTDDFYHLYLPLETQRYILRIVAAKQILSDPAKYGFHLTEDDLYAPIPVQRVEVACPRETPIRIIAEAAGTYFKEIKDLNPEIRGSTLPRGNHYISLPPEGAEGFQARYRSLLNQWRAEETRKNNPPGAQRVVYTVRRGDSLGAIAQRFGVGLDDLLRWNRISSHRPIHPGQRLVIFQSR